MTIVLTIYWRFKNSVLSFGFEYVNYTEEMVFTGVQYSEVNFQTSPIFFVLESAAIKIIFSIQYFSTVIQAWSHFQHSQVTSRPICFVFYELVRKTDDIDNHLSNGDKWGTTYNSQPSSKFGWKTNESLNEWNIKMNEWNIKMNWY